MQQLAFYKNLCEIAGAEQVRKDEPMARHTSFHIGGPAEFFVTPEANCLPAVIALCKRSGVPYTIIGNGSNLLCADSGINGVVIEIGKQMAEVTITGETVCAQAGALLSSVAAKAAKEGLAGFAFAAGIPGSIGGAVVMNAGAYGGEMKDVLVSADVLTVDGEVKTVSARELELSYRHSAIGQNQWIVLSVVLAFARSNSEAIYERMAELKEQRQSKQPLEYPSAGSTFKRPEGHFAGKLIEDAGLRGVCVGDAQVAEKHCGFVINRGNATAADVLCLMERVRREVLEQFGVELEPEVKLVGEF